MHPWILGGGLLLAGNLAPPALAGAGAACPATNAAVAERFIAADCLACWAAGQAPAQAGATAGTARARAVDGWTLDWLLPGGAEAAMSAAALPEAAERARRAGLPAAGASADSATPAQREQPARPRRPGLVLRVVSGPAWQGYFGLQLSLSVGPATRLPAGTTAWLALVEQIPAGAEGSALPRQLVRSVAGPLSLDALQAMRAGRPLSHLQALRWPEGAQPTRLRARGWIEAPDGRVLAMAADRCD